MTKNRPRARNGAARQPPGPGLLRRIQGDPRYKGRNLMILARKVYVADSRPSTVRRMDAAIRSHPNDQPLFVNAPADETLILWQA